MQPLNARRIFRLACCLLLCTNTLVASVLWAERRRLTALLTPDAAVAAQMQRILPAAILGIIGDGQVAVLGGLLRAAGRQGTGALLYLTSYWGVGLPLGITLGFWLDWGALGLWMGVASATALQAVFVHTWAALRLDWGREVLRSQANIDEMLDSHGGPAAQPPVVGVEDAEERGGGVTQPLLGGRA